MSNQNKQSQLIFSKAAQVDVDDIFQHSIEQWGFEQAEIYSKKLNKGFQTIFENPLIGTSREDILPGYRSFTAEKHLIID